MTISRRKHGNSTRFYAQKQYKGVRYSKLFDTQEDAQEWLDDLAYLGATDSKGNPTRKAKAAQLIIDEIDQARARNETPTLKECIPLYLTGCDNKTTLESVQRIQAFTALLNRPINEITRLEFELELDRIQDAKELSDATRNRYQSALSSLYKFIMRQKDFKKYSLINPTQGAPRGKESKGRHLFLEKEQQIKLLEACKASEWKGFYIVVFLLLATGSRKGEITRLRWENVDLKQGIVTLVKTKNGSDHAVKLPQSAIKMLREWKLSQPLSNWVFQHRKDPRRPMVHIEYHWNKAKKRAQMPKELRIHDLRHTAASTMLLDGFSLEEIQSTLNHKTLAMTLRYAKALNIKTTVEKRDLDYLQGAM
ncbi:site-specific integrase [Thiomicrospira sp. ALE5]|uniref:tyrosine-type recombinase/integrase n=1 Tax=Thiomicrospira sp. ALE5 TaxID=748650 RepID=UPI0008F28CED|nr:site-specific integrase [Thiomicrospira sp. ALE5]SFR50794.1 Site-specific recombinase XerD [Thiomicrospira sp. ALE5]